MRQLAPELRVGLMIRPGFKGVRDGGHAAAARAVAGGVRDRDERVGAVVVRPRRVRRDAAVGAAGVHEAVAGVDDGAGLGVVLLSRELRHGEGLQGVAG